MNSNFKNKLHKAALTVIGLSLMTTVFAQKETNYKVSGKLEGLQSDQKIYLGTTYMGKNMLDSTVTKNGEFSFAGKTPGMLMYGLRLSKGFYVTVPVDINENIIVKGNVANPKETLITGSKGNKVWTEWANAWSTITARAGVLYKVMDSVGKVPDKKGDRTWVDAEFKKLDQRLIDSVESFVKRYPSSPVIPFIIYDRFINYPNPAKAQSTFAALTKEAKSSPYGKEVEESLRIAGKTGIGVKPDFTLPDQNGKPLKLSSLKGKVVLVDFWASWCAPCRKENPNLVKAYAKYHDKGFEIVGVSLDEKKDAWLNAIKADTLTWEHVSDLKGWKSALVTEYGIKAVPTSFLVDESGKIIAKDLRGEALEKKLATLFK